MNADPVSALVLAAALAGCLVGVVTVAALLVQLRRAKTLARKQTEEKQRLEAQLQLAARLEVVGRLASSIAHEFNNLLTVINGCAQLLDDESANDPNRARLTDAIRRAGLQAAALTGQLRILSRDREIKPQPISLNKVVEEVGFLLMRLMGERFAVQLRTEESLPQALGDSAIVFQTLLNLALNAHDAMPDGGTFTLSTSRAEPGWVRLTAADTGCGMTDEVKRHIFERYYTTKGANKGTGLGLSIVYDNVKQLGGTISFDSEHGRGTAFVIELPAAPVQPARPDCAAPRSSTVAALTTSDEPVRVNPAARTPVAMLVEDNEEVRSFADQVLLTCGLTVLTATGPEDALRLLDDYTGSLDILVTDVVMPEMSGRELADRVRAVRPGVKVLFMSGYLPDDVLREGVQEDQVNFLHKPFSVNELKHVIQRLLHEPAAP